MIGNKKAALFALFLISYSIFYTIFPDMSLGASVFFGAGFGILIAWAKND